MVQYKSNNISKIPIHREEVIKIEGKTTAKRTSRRAGNPSFAFLNYPHGPSCQEIMVLLRKTNPIKPNLTIANTLHAVRYTLYETTPIPARRDTRYAIRDTRYEPPAQPAWCVSFRQDCIAWERPDVTAEIFFRSSAVTSVSHER